MAHAEGLAAGREEALAALAARRRRARGRRARGARGRAAAATARLEAHAVDLALLLAEKILGAAVEVDPALVRRGRARRAARAASSASA